ncbi:hypothetical protein P0F24_002855 [Vibrio metschnikovii]|nr:hypothetical protein [Vibrio metschnikovii]
MNKHAQMMVAVGRLNHHHCLVLRTNTAPAIPVIEIDSPYSALAEKAIEVMERRNGQLSKAYVARFSGCLVRWLSSVNSEVQR